MSGFLYFHFPKLLRPFATGKKKTKHLRKYLEEKKKSYLIMLIH